MGSRCNLVIVGNGPAPASLELRYSHWSAGRIDHALFWGLEAALAFARAQRGEDDGADWLDEVWGEGGAVIDLDRRRLTFFGGEDLAYDVPRRRVQLELMATLWPGWALCWAARASPSSPTPPACRATGC